MSSKVFFNGGGNKKVSKPFCKVCQDAGKEEKVFSSHWVKDNQGNVCCPTLLSQKCRYCDELGHTTNYCQALKKLKESEQRMATRLASDEVRREREETRVQKTAAAAAKPSNNKWAALDDDSDDEEKLIKIIKPSIAKDSIVSSAAATADFPPLSANVTLRPHQKAFGSSFANVAAAASHLPDPIYALQAKAKAEAAIALDDDTAVAAVAKHVSFAPDSGFVSLNAMTRSTTTIPKFPFIAQKASTMNWADWDDSDDDDDDDCDEY
jgi:hypothetical protein